MQMLSKAFVSYEEAFHVIFIKIYWNISESQLA